MAWTSVVFPLPISPDRPITTGAVSRAPTSSPNRLSSSAERRIGLQLEDLVSQHCRQLEIELLRGRLHLLLQQPDERVALLGVGGAPDAGVRALCGARLGDAGAQTEMTRRPYH